MRPIGVRQGLITPAALPPGLMSLAALLAELDRSRADR
jgi:hypothetical protein